LFLLIKFKPIVVSALYQMIDYMYGICT